MTTATRFVAPTEAEVRAHVETALDIPHPVGGTPENDWEIGWAGIRSIAAPMYDIEDMRDSELQRLDELVDDATRPIQEEARRATLEAIVQAMLRYGIERPETPRAKS